MGAVSSGRSWGQERGTMPGDLFSSLAGPTKSGDDKDAFQMITKIHKRREDTKTDVELAQRLENLSNTDA
ncbi:hypothetical protein TruAng_000116 [Truncatella angustata]|nr:hypothetical protein TruAng_000116 [Truncatella angustata]